MWIKMRYSEIAFMMKILPCDPICFDKTACEKKSLFSSLPDLILSVAVLILLIIPCLDKYVKI